MWARNHAVRSGLMHPSLPLQDPFSTILLHLHFILTAVLHFLPGILKEIQMLQKQSVRQKDEL